jgi:zinc/manganese transport system ATP-binding protein
MVSDTADPHALGPAVARAAAAWAPSAPVIEVTGAAARAGRALLWSGVDLVLRPGEFLAVLGPNGAGKSTLVKILLGLTPAAGGTIRVLGGSPGRANHRIGYLPQRHSFDGSVRIRGTDIVRLGLDGHRWGVPLPGVGPRRSRRQRAARQRVAEAIDLVGASGYANRPIGELSGGEQQRLLIAQALVQRPALLLLDEPLDSLDLPNQVAVAALVSRICKDESVAVVMVAHDVNPILPYLDRVLYIALGGAAASGTPAEVITTSTLTRLFGTPVEVLTASDGRLVVVGEPEPPALHIDRHEQSAPGRPSRARPPSTVSGPHGRAGPPGQARGAGSGAP